MANPLKPIPPYIQRGLLCLIILLMGVSVARLLVTMHRQQERIEILELQVSQLMADTSRLQIPSYASPQHYSNHGYYPRRHNDYRPRGRHTDSRSIPTTTAAADTGDSVAASPRAHSEESPRVTTNPNSESATKRKFTEVHQFDLNTIDSATLVRIPGIAERTAAVILKNRQRYGGFTSSWQLQEFLTWEAAQAYMDEWCNSWFTVDMGHIRPIHINTATISEMQRHPYISHEQAMELVRYRTRHKRITSATELSQMQTLNEEQINRLLPYLAFD